MNGLVPCFSKNAIFTTFQSVYSCFSVYRHNVVATQNSSYLYFVEIHMRSTKPLEGAGGHRRTNDPNASIDHVIGQKMCRRCSGKYMLCRHGCTDRFPKISGKLSACANSGYQALFFFHQPRAWLNMYKDRNN